MYANYEQSLAALFAHLMSVTPDYAGVPFFRLNNARARSEILERLLHKRHGSDYNVFWNSLKRYHMRPLDERRNNVVHWGSMANVFLHAETKEAKVIPSLDPQNFWDRTENTPKAYLDDLYDFMLRCDFVMRLVNMFVLVISGKTAEIDNAQVQAELQTWREICQQQVTYPPPSSHPLYRKPPVF